jgi:hypothetical protein
MAADWRTAAITRRSLLLEGAILLALLLSSFTATVALSDPTGESNCSIYIKEERVCVETPTLISGDLLRDASQFFLSLLY